MIRVLTTYYNSFEYLNWTIKSLKDQTVNDWVCYITDDVSNDGSSELIKDLIVDDERFVVIHNKTKHYQTGNYWQVLQRNDINDEDICVTLDGDDWLFDECVFERVNEYYSNPNVWMTFGQFVFDDGKNIKNGFTHKPKDFDNVRNVGWTSSHMRSFKAWLFRKIKKKHLINPHTKNFWASAGDVACFAPMLEMAGEDRVIYVDDLNYVYNTETPLNDFKVNLHLQEEVTRMIGALPKYKRL